MKCVILAAGEGKRMHPLTFTRPKVMVSIANKPILEWNLINAIDAGFNDFIFVVGYKSEMVRNYFGNGNKWNVNIKYINQGKALGTAHAINTVKKFVDNFIVLCGDTIFGKDDIKNVCNIKLCMGLLEVKNPKSYGIVETKKDKVIKIYEKLESPFTNIINAGIYHFNKKIFDYIKKTTKSLRGEYEITDSINMMIEKTDMNCIFLKQWRDVVYPWHLLEANEELLKKMNERIDGKVENNSTIKGSIVIGNNSIVMNGTYIEGPVIIGEYCKIGPNSYIRPYTAIGNNCHIGNACEIKNSIIFSNSKIPHNSYVGDSVIGENCNIGAGTKIANLRFDKGNIDVVLNGDKINSERRKLGVVMGDNTQTGINSTINTGSFIGNNVFIGPGATVKGYIQPLSKIM